jgi:hypothetical protein
LFLQCYGKDRLQALVPSALTAADRFGMNMVYLSTPGGAWSWNNTVVNDANPRPCSADVAGQDYTYVKEALQFLNSQPAIDSKRVYTYGFSQNGMGSAYVGRCFSTSIAGSWIGGGGLFSPGHGPVPPNKAGTCSDGCKYWPVFPCHTGTEATTVQSCIQFYSNDPVTVDQRDPATGPRTKGHGLYLFDRLVSEANDGRLLEFAPDEAQGIKGGHSGPRNEFDWVVGCFGSISHTCSSACETALLACVEAGRSSKGSAGAYESCIGASPGCTRGCTPTYKMLSSSESPALNLTQGSRWGLPAVEEPRPSTSVCETAPTPPTPPPAPTPPPPPTPSPPTPPPTPPTPAPAPTPASPIPANCLAAAKEVCPGMEGGGGACETCLKKHQWDPTLEKPCAGAHAPFGKVVAAYCDSAL